jgi:exopolysaccharide biosynthesis WecB/TagA/CpsF family protein
LAADAPLAMALGERMEQIHLCGDARRGTDLESVLIEGVSIWNPTEMQVMDWWQRILSPQQTESVRVAILNAHSLNLARRDRSYHEALLGFDMRLNDGIGIALAAKMRGTPIHHNCQGTDMIPQVLSRLRHPTRVFLYGASDASNLGAAERISKEFPQARVVGRIHGFVDPECEALPAIRSASPDLLLVATGQPRQEMFLHRNRDELGARVAVGVGALFDFLSGTVRRAPDGFTRLRCEWLYRLAIEPRRMFGRYVLGNPLFLANSALRARQDRFARLTDPVGPYTLRPDARQRLASTDDANRTS